jgi:glyoxylase-like metal-dependent hydrolase (beta-lactamase superfamily II)
MRVQAFIVGVLATNCYVVNCRDTGNAVIIDPGFDSDAEAEQVFRYVDEEKLKIKFVVDTHGHSDHIGGNNVLRKRYGVAVCVHELDAQELSSSEKGTLLPNIMFRDGDWVEFADAKLKVVHTPGHTPGSICLLGEKLVFTGDTLFAGGIGRTDFPGGSDRDMKVSLEKVLRLPDGLSVYPGHGPATTISEEKRSNPFLSFL